MSEYKDVEIIEAHAMPDHIHMLVTISPKLVEKGKLTKVSKGRSSFYIINK